MKKEFEELLKEIAGQDIAIQVGPGGKATLMGSLGGKAGEEAKENIQKDVQDMKDFLSKSVEQLASGSNQNKELQIIDVRDRKLVVQKTPGRSRTESVLVACLYAANNQGIDSVLKQIGIHGHFQMDDGTVQIQPIIQPKKEAVVASGAMAGGGSWGNKVKEAAPDEDAKRNILVEEEKPEQPLKVGDPVVVKNKAGDPDKMGEITNINEDDSYVVKDMYGDHNPYGKESLILIESVADAAQWAARIIHWKAASLGNNG